MSIGNRRHILGGMEKSLAVLLRNRIDSAYGGNQSDFARATGFTTQTISTWLKGRVTLPQIDARRRLAEELGISHVELLVVVGELSEQEVQESGLAGIEPVSPAERALLPIIRGNQWSTQQIRAAAGSLLAIAQMGKE